MSRRLIDNLLIPLCVASFASATAAFEPIFPPALKPGDTIAIVAPAGPMKPGELDLAISRLKEMGYQVRVAEDIYEKTGYLAGSDEKRAKELMDAFCLLYTSPSPRDQRGSRMPSSA